MHSHRFVYAVLVAMVLEALGTAASAIVEQHATMQAPAVLTASSPLLQNSRPYVIAHRGASGPLPEHTLPAYQLAIDQGADFIECDVQVTKDLQLICRHDPVLDTTTDAAKHFGDRNTTYTVDGEQKTGIFAADLTLAEVQQLKAKQRWDFRDHSHDYQYGVATFEEYLDLALNASRAVGVYPEAKHPAWHNQLPQLRAAGTTIEQLIVAALHARGYAASAPYGSTAWRAWPVFIQSFELSSLRRFAELTPVPLVLLAGGWEGDIDPDTGLSLEQMTSDAFLATLAPFVAVVAPWKVSLYTLANRAASPAAASIAATPLAAAAAGVLAASIPLDANSSSSGSSGSSRVVLESSIAFAPLDADAGSIAGFAHPDVGMSVEMGRRLQEYVVESTGLTERLLRHGFDVHTWTLRDESQFVLPPCAGHIACEYEWLFKTQKINGGFADWPGTAVQWFERQ